MENENKSIDIHLDCSLIKNEIDSQIRQRTDELDTLSDSDVSSLFSYEQIEYDCHDDYICPVFVVDVEKNSAYPLFIFRCNHENDRVSLIKDFPIINEQAVQMIKDNGIEIPDIKSDDIVGCVKSINDQIERKSRMNSINVLFALKSFNSDFLLSLSILPVLSDYLKTSNIDEKYEILFKTQDRSEVESTIENDDIGLFAREERVKKRLEGYKTAKISYQGRAIVDELIKNKIDNCIKEQDSLALIVPENEYEEVRKYLSSLMIDDFILSKEELADLPGLLTGKEYKKIDTSSVSRMHDVVERYLLFLNKKNEKLHSVKKEYFNVVNSLLKVQSKIIPIESNPYGHDDLEKDRGFFDLTKDIADKFHTPIKKNPYFGYIKEGTHEDYEVLQLAFLRLDKCLKELVDVIGEAKFLSDYNIVIENDEQFSRVEKSFAVLNEYNGFPRKYFQLKENEKDLPLSVLKEKNKKLSSSKLIVENLFENSILELDIDNLVNRYKNGNIFQKAKVKKEIRKYLKNKSTESFDVIIDIISLYIDAKKSLEEILPTYLEEYGDNVLTMNGVLEIENNISYVHKFNEYSLIVSQFSLEHPFIKRYLKDKDFRKASQYGFSKIKAIHDEFVSITEELRSIFDVEHTISSISYQELMIKTDEYRTLAYTDFNAYVLVRDGLQNASWILKNTILSFSDDCTLDEFKSIYFDSLLVSWADSNINEFKPYQKGFDDSKKAFDDMLVDFNEASGKERYINLVDIVTARKEKCRTDMTDIRNALLNGEYYSKIKGRLCSLLVSLYPISLLTPSMLYMLPDDLFDHAMILDTGLLSNTELLNSYRIGKDVLIVNDRALFDFRTQGYHETLMNEEVLYKGMFDYSKLPDGLLERFKDEYDLIEKDGFLVYEKEGRIYLFAPDILLADKADSGFMIELSLYVASHYNQTIDYLDVLSYVRKKRP